VSLVRDGTEGGRRLVANSAHRLVIAAWSFVFWGVMHDPSVKGSWRYAAARDAHPAGEEEKKGRRRFCGRRDIGKNLRGFLREWEYCMSRGESLRPSATELHLCPARSQSVGSVGSRVGFLPGLPSREGPMGLGAMVTA